MLPARLRSGSGWSDACILNISSGGLLIFSRGAAEPGHKVEIRRGGRLVIARVAWRQNQRIGLESDGPIPVAEIINAELADAGLPAMPCVRIERSSDVRRRPDSRMQGRLMEFLTAVLMGTVMAGLAAASVQETLARPLATVRSALAGP